MFGLMLFLREGTGEAKILIFVLSIFNAYDVIHMTHSHWCPMVSSPHDALQHASYIQFSQSSSWWLAGGISVT